MATPDPLQRLRLGIRAVVRHELPGGGHTDAVGTIEALDATTVTVHTRHRVEVIPLAAISIVKEVPPRPVRRGAPHRALSMSDLQRVIAAGWPAVEQEQLGDWLLRASAGYTRRANSLLPVGDPGLELSSAVDRAERWYAERGLPCQVSLHGPLGFADRDDPLGAELLARGYRPQAPTMVLTASTSPAPGAAAPAPGPADLEVLTHAEPPLAWWSLGDARAAESPERRAAAERIVTGAPEQVFLEARAGGVTIAVARVAFAHVWAGLTGLAVHPEHRRRGLATRLVAEAGREARERGVRSIYLQVEPSNESALRLYQRLGFEPHHEYRYLLR
jgi:GNAT superfamily N-acetyltransferase